jgi:hypothetical protein
VKVKSQQELGEAAGEKNVLFRTKPGVDWEAIETRVRAGDSFSAIAKDYPITRQRVAEVAKERGWIAVAATADPAMQDAPAGALRWYRAILQTDIGKAAHPSANKEHLPVLVDFVLDSRFDVAVAAHVLDDLEQAVPEKVAVQCRGLTPEQWQVWRKADGRFEALVRAARAAAAKKLVGGITKAAEFDWKAASYLLEREVAKEEYAAPREGGGGGPAIVVQVNVQRDEQVAIAAGVQRPVIELVPSEGVKEGEPVQLLPKPPEIA